MSVVRIVQEVCDHFLCRVTINSGCRCHRHNKACGGAYTSKHLEGLAADCNFWGVSPHEVYDFLDKEYPDSLGLGEYQTFIHIDTRENGPARW